MRVAKIGAKALPLRLKPTRIVTTSARRQPSFFDDDPFFSSASSLFDDLDREVADLGARIASSSEALPPAPVRRREGESEQEQQKTTLLPGGKGYARTRSSSGRTATSSWSSSESVVVWGVEPPTTAAPTQHQQQSFLLYSPLGQLAGAALLLYAAVAARFARRTLDGETKYKTAARWRLAALWPALAALSPEFRQELKEALALEKRGRRKGAAAEEEAKKEAGGSSGGSGVALFSSPEGQRREGADNASPFDER